MPLLISTCKFILNIQLPLKHPDITYIGNVQINATRKPLAWKRITEESQYCFINANSILEWNWWSTQPLNYSVNNIPWTVFDFLRKANNGWMFRYISRKDSKASDLYHGRLGYYEHKERGRYCSLLIEYFITLNSYRCSQLLQ